MMIELTAPRPTSIVDAVFLVGTDAAAFARLAAAASDRAGVPVVVVAGDGTRMAHTPPPRALKRAAEQRRLRRELHALERPTDPWASRMQAKLAVVRGGRR